MAMPEQLKKQVDETAARYNDKGELRDPNVPDESGENLDEPAKLEAVAPITDGITPTAGATTADEPVTKPLSGEPDAGKKQEPDVNEELRVAQQRYSSLQGMYNSNISQLREATGQIEQLRQAIATLQSPTAPNQPEQTSVAPGPGVTDAEREEYSPAFFEMMDRYMGNKMAPLKASLESVQQLPGAVGQINDNVQGIARAQHQSAEARFFDDLTAQHPDWQAINNSAAYSNWLQVTDPLSGYTRKALLDEARDRLDLNLVSNSFDQFKATTSTTGQAVQNKSQKDGLQDQAVLTPRKAQSSVPADSNVKPNFTKADLDKLYSDQLRGKYRGKEDEFKKRERELLEAINSGRYTS